MMALKITKGLRDSVKRIWNGGQQSEDSLIDRLRRRVADLEARLEIDHIYQHVPGTKNDSVRIEIPPEERDDQIDGIEARDATIRLLEEQNERYVERIRMLEGMRDHWARDARQEADVNLVNVYDVHGEPSRCAIDVLWRLLSERDGDGDVNISHRKMPTYEEHVAFVKYVPYLNWLMIQIGESGPFVGSIYIDLETSAIGIFVLKAHQGKGYGTAAIRKLLSMHPGQEFIANVNPRNERSIRLWTEKFGAVHIQNTYRLFAPIQPIMAAPVEPKK